MAFPTGWGRRVAITIDNTKVSGSADHTDFPVLITEDNLPSEMFDADGTYPALNGGGDVRFTSDEAGSTLLNLEVVDFTTDNNPANGTAQLWVKVPSLSSSADTTIYCWYNKSGETQPAADATGGSEGVWSDYSLVYHLDESTGDVIDSSGNDNGTRSGATTSVAGQIGNSYDFDGTNDLINGIASIGSVGSNITFSLWYKADAFQSGTNRNQLAINYISATDRMILTRSNDTGRVQLDTFDGTSVRSHGVTTSDTTNWHHFVATSNTSKAITTYLDTVAGETSTYTGGNNPSDGTLVIGINDGNNFGWNGKIDEFRIRQSILSSDWVATEYANQNAPADFSSAGTPENPGGTAYTQEIDETLSVSDIVSVKVTAKKILDSVDLVDIIYKTASRFFSEAINLVDSIATSLVMVKSFSEEVYLTDDQELKQTAKRINENVDTTDSILYQLIINKELSDNVTLVDTVNSIKQFFKNITETTTLVDSIVKLLTAGIRFVEGLSLVDRLFGLLNGRNMKYNNKYEDNIDTYTDKYSDNSGDYTNKYNKV